MTLAQLDFRLDAGSDWQRSVRLRDPDTGNLVALSNALMEIRNANFQLALRLDAPSGYCLIGADGATVLLSIPGEVSLTVFAHGNFPGTYQAVGYWGIGRSYLYDLFVTYENGADDRILKGFFYVDPNVTQPLPAPTSMLSASLIP